MPSTTLTIGQIEISPLNVRINHEDAHNIAGLADNILARGLLNAIDVHPMKGRKGVYGAVAGGRRTRAIKSLVADARLPADWPVEVNIHTDLTDAELIELSLSENLPRLNLRDHELFAGIARAAAKGHDIAQIAAGVGQSDLGKVTKWLRLGRLARPVFDALAAGELSLEQARAYAATEDQDLQAAVFAQLGRHNEYGPRAAEIRRAMKVGDAQLRRQLMFVGEVVYRAAGGRYELDLFAEDAEERGRVADEGLLARLVEEKMDAVRAEVRTSFARLDLRFVPQPPQTDYQTDDYQLQVTPRRDGDQPKLPKGDVVAHIKLDAGGEPTVTFWWADRKAKFGSDKVAARAIAPAPRRDFAPGAAIDDGASPGTRRDADAAIKEDTGLGQDSIQILRALRRAILRAVLVADADTGGDVATDYLVWAQLRLTLDLRSSGVGMGKLPVETIGGYDLAQRARTQLEASGVAAPVAEALRELSAQPFATLDPVPGFRAYLTTSRRLKALAAAVVCGQALDRSLNAPGYALPIHDAVAAEARGDADDAVRAHCSPTAELIELFPRAQLLVLFTPALDPAEAKRWDGMKVAALRTAALEHALADETWVHPLLRFDPPPDDRAGADTIEQAEAAE